MAMWKSDRRLWLNADRTQVLEDGDPNASFLLVGENGEIPLDLARKYNLGNSAPGETAVEREARLFQSAVGRGAFVEAASRAATLNVMEASATAADNGSAGEAGPTPFQNAGPETRMGLTPDPALDTQAIATANASKTAPPPTTVAAQEAADAAPAKNTTEETTTNTKTNEGETKTEGEATGSAGSKQVSSSENKQSPAITPNAKPAANDKAETK